MTIREYLDIERGAHRPCPLCESADAFSFMPDGKARAPTGVWRCFSCGKSGDGISYLMQVHGLSYMDACKELSVDVPKLSADRKLRWQEEQRHRQRVKASYWGRLYELSAGTSEPPADWLAERPHPTPEEIATLDRWQDQMARRARSKVFSPPAIKRR